MRDVTGKSGDSGGIRGVYFHGMETRARKPSPSTKAYSQDEIEVILSSIKEKETRLKEQAEAIRVERANFDIERTNLNMERDTFAQSRDQTRRDFEQIQTSLNVREAELSRRMDTTPDAPIDPVSQQNQDLAREIASLRREMEYLKAGPASHSRANDSSPYPPDFVHDNHIPRVTFREALDPVPNFDGYNLSLPHFIRACRQARDTVPIAAERSLTRLLISKLRGRARYAVEDEQCDSIVQLTDILTRAFAIPKTLDQHRGELSTIFLQRREHMLDYILRVKDLRTAILDIMRRQQGYPSPEVIEEVDALTARSFCEGLPPHFRINFRSEHYSRPFEAFSHAKELAMRHELDLERFGPTQRTEAPRDRTRMHPIGQPLAHSTPMRHRDDYQPGRRENYQPDRRDEYQPRNREYQPPRRDDYRVRRPEDSRGGYRQADATGSPRQYTNYNRPSAPPQRDLGTPPRGPPTHARSAPQSQGYGNNAQRTAASPKWCRYCKATGHEINECRKRQYNNAQSGNFNRPVGNSDESRREPTRGHLRPIATTETTTDAPAVSPS